MHWDCFFSKQLQIALKSEEPLQLAGPWACAFCMQVLDRLWGGSSPHAH